MKKYFEGSDIKPYMFRAVLKAVRFKIEGWSASTHELLGHGGDGTQNNREYEQATHSRNILKNIKADLNFSRQNLF